jgi:preprotein translocase subunit SecF
MNWMKYRLLYFAISFLIIIPGVISLALYQFKPAIDFVGGSILELKFETSDLDNAKQIITSKYKEASFVQNDQNLIVNLPPISQSEATAIKTELAPKYPNLSETSFTTVGPRAGRELLDKTVVALLITTTVVLLYIARTFKSLRFGVSATVATLHDTLIMLGSFSLLGHFFGVEVDLLFVTALLTTISFSVHDTIVVYDRIRELQHRHTDVLFIDLVNRAVSETLVRSLNNSLTIIFMLLALVLLGGETIRWFAVALLIGAVTGTYSSTFTAAPLLVVWDKLAHRSNKKK